MFYVVIRTVKKLGSHVYSTDGERNVNTYVVRSQTRRNQARIEP